MNRPLISVIIPVYNAESSIKKIVSRILAEGLEDIEIILVDDGSTDSSLQVLRGLKSNRKDIVVISQRNGGPSSARNSGIKKAKGQYIQFFDADDNIEPGALKVIARNLQLEKPDILISGWIVDLDKNGKLIEGYKKISPAGEKISNDITKYVTKSIGQDGKLYNLWNKTVRTDIVHDNSLTFRDDLRFGEDLVFGLEVFKNSRNLVVIPDITYRYKSSNTSGVFSKTSLMPEYRIVNNEALAEFVGSKRDTELDDLFNWVKWRWLLSYWLIVAESQQPASDKLRSIKAISTTDFVVAKNSKFIGTKKLFMERAANILRRNARLALTTAKLIVFAKNTKIKLKSIAKN